jgi:hypothetical protein
VSGLVLGLAMAAYYTVIAILIYAFAGSAPFEAYNTSLDEALAAYWIGGLLGGITFGLIKPLARNRLGAVVVGIMVAAPASAAIGFTVDKNVPWQAVAIMAVIFGTIGGLVVSNSFGPATREMDELEERADRLLAGELSEEEVTALAQKYEMEKRARADKPLMR